MGLEKEITKFCMWKYKSYEPNTVNPTIADHIQAQQTLQLSFDSCTVIRVDSYSQMLQDMWTGTNPRANGQYLQTVNVASFLSDSQLKEISKGYLHWHGMINDLSNNLTIFLIIFFWILGERKAVCYFQFVSFN